MKHLRKFDSVTDMQTAIETAAVDFIGLAYDAQEGTANVRIAKEVPPDPKATPFYIDVRSTVTLAATSGLQMSTDGKNWTDTATGDLPSGKTYFRVASDQTSPLKPNWTEKSNSDYDIGGNINSLVKTSFKNDTTCYKFYINNDGFFYNKTKLKSAGDLILPATTLVQECYSLMFAACMSLTTAPAILPATTLANNCYQNMFSYCTSLTSVPALPATALAQNCYQCMFSGCESLTTAPELPATTLAQYCYNEMFYGCASLTIVPAILPATTLVPYCYQDMFSSCTSLTTAPALPATTLAESCYESMFHACSNLNYIKCLATNISATNCTRSWVNSVASTGTFVKNPDMPTTSWGSGIPSGWTVQDATE